MEQLIQFILIGGIVLNLIALVNLFRIRNKVLPQKVLIVFWLYILVIISHFYFGLLDLKYSYIITYFFEDGARFCIPPLIYIYVKSIFLDHKNFIGKNGKHFIPFIIYVLFYSFPQLLNGLSGELLFHYPIKIYNTINLALVKDVFGIVYFSLALQLFFRAKTKMKTHYSSLTEQGFSWLQKFLISFLLVVVVDLLITVNEIYFGYDVTWDAYITLVFLVSAIAYVGYYGFTQLTVFIPDLVLDENTHPYHTVSNKDEQEANHLKVFIETDKTFLIPNLTLPMLTEKVQIPTRRLSFLFNNVLGIPFYDFINGYRVEEAKKRLVSADSDKYTITGIGLSCGFNSKSSFYRIFKNKVGVSPFQYKKDGQ
ncbi:MAG: helix-turn-helix domain-containing protein [Bacteroidota bacterium]